MRTTLLIAVVLAMAAAAWANPVPWACCLPEPLGACCIGVICEVMLDDNRTLLEGVFMGTGTTCTPNPCEAVCCLQTPTSPHGCEIMLEDGCLAAQGA